MRPQVHLILCITSNNNQTDTPEKLTWLDMKIANWYSEGQQGNFYFAVLANN